MLKAILHQRLPSRTIPPTKIQSAISICGSYLGHSAPRKTRKTGTAIEVKFMQPHNNKKYRRSLPRPAVRLKLGTGVWPSLQHIDPHKQRPWIYWLDTEKNRWGTGGRGSGPHVQINLKGNCSLGLEKYIARLWMGSQKGKKKDWSLGLALMSHHDKKEYLTHAAVPVVFKRMASQWLMSSSGFNLQWGFELRKSCLTVQ